MAGGIVFAGITYRDMRAERAVHELLRVCRTNLSRTSGWQVEPLPIFLNGTYALWLSADNPSPPNRDSRSIGTTASPPAIIYEGQAEIIVERPQGNIVLRSSLGPGVRGTETPDRLIWFQIDSLLVTDSSAQSRISMRVVRPDSQFAGKLAEIVVIPPHAGEFGEVLQKGSYKLFTAGILIVAGFMITIFGGNLHRERIPQDNSKSASRSNLRKEKL